MREHHNPTDRWPDYRTLVLARDRGVATITLNRPRQRNAVGDGMRDELADAYRTCDRDDGVRVIVLTGTPPAFCAGADLGEGEDTFAAPGPGFSAAGIDVPAWSLSKPVIAAVNGHAIGLGLTLALQCDIRFFAADARYGVVQVRRGVVGDAYSHWVLPRLVGIANAAEILLTGATFDGHRAVQLGLGSRVLDADEVLPAALDARARHRREHRADVGGGQQAVAVGLVRPRPRGVGARETDIHLRADGPRRRQGGGAGLHGRADSAMDGQAGGSNRRLIQARREREPGQSPAGKRWPMGAVDPSRRSRASESEDLPCRGAPRVHPAVPRGRRYD